MTRDINDTGWRQQLWAELQSLPAEEQFLVAGAWIAQITQNLLPELGRHRRENVLELLSRDGSSIATVAGQLGMRRSTVSRLVDEGRSIRRHEHELLEQTFPDGPGSATTGYSARTLA